MRPPKGQRLTGEDTGPGGAGVDRRRRGETKGCRGISRRQEIGTPWGETGGGGGPGRDRGR